MRRILLPLASIAVCVALYFAFSGGDSGGGTVDPASLPQTAPQGSEVAQDIDVLPEVDGADE
ncbi:MAG: hypothetical protein MK291_10990, partial [Planctomycetes bacterium]|nr:hypothetical protein [Planctomycetota bacterium]